MREDHPDCLTVVGSDSWNGAGSRAGRKSFAGLGAEGATHRKSAEGAGGSAHRKKRPRSGRGKPVPRIIPGDL